MVFAVVVVACLATAGTSLVRRRPSYAWGLLAFSAVWLPLSNGPFEGRTLVALSATHGVTTADIAAVVAFLAALVVLLRHEHRQHGFDLHRLSRVAAVSTAVFCSGALLALVSG